MSHEGVLFDEFVDGSPVKGWTFGSVKEYRKILKESGLKEVGVRAQPEKGSAYCPVDMVP